MKDLKKLFSLEGKTVVLTGAGGFIGTSFAEGLLDAGASKLLCVDVSLKALETLKERLASRFDVDQWVSLHVLDQYDHPDSEQFWDAVTRQNKVDVLVNNSFDHLSARTGFPVGGDTSGKIETATTKQLLSSFDSGCIWPFQAIQMLGNISKETGRKLSVVNIGSMYSFVTPDPALYEGTPYFNPPGYSMAKTALLALTRTTPAWYAPTVRVNALCPGAIPNPEKSQNQIPEFTKRLTERTVLKRLGTTEDLVGPLIFLASDASAYMTGQTVVVDGGWTIV